MEIIDTVIKNTVRILLRYRQAIQRIWQAKTECCWTMYLYWQADSKRNDY